MLRHSRFFRHMESAFGPQLLELRIARTGDFRSVVIQTNTYAEVDSTKYKADHVSPEQHES